MPFEIVKCINWKLCIRVVINTESFCRTVDYIESQKFFKCRFGDERITIWFTCSFDLNDDLLRVWATAHTIHMLQFYLTAIIIIIIIVGLKVVVHSTKYEHKCRCSINRNIELNRNFFYSILIIESL